MPRRRLTAGALDAADDEGNTALQHACLHGVCSVAEQLLAAGASPDLVNKDNKTGVDLSMENPLKRDAGKMEAVVQVAIESQLPAILDDMRNEGNGDEAQAQACLRIVSLAPCAEESQWRKVQQNVTQHSVVLQGYLKMHELGVTEALLNIMERHPSSELLAVSVCKLLNIVGRHLKVRGKFFASSGVSRLLSVMETHSASSSVQEAALVALRHFICCHGKTAAESGKSMQLLINAMQAHQGECNVQRAACFTISEIPRSFETHYFKPGDTLELKLDRTGQTGVLSLTVHDSVVAQIKGLPSDVALFPAVAITNKDCRCSFTFGTNMGGAFGAKPATANAFGAPHQQSGSCGHNFVNPRWSLSAKEKSMGISIDALTATGSGWVRTETAVPNGEVATWQLKLSAGTGVLRVFLAFLLLTTLD